MPNTRTDPYTGLSPLGVPRHSAKWPKWHKVYESQQPIRAEILRMSQTLNQTWRPKQLLFCVNALMSLNSAVSPVFSCVSCSNSVSSSAATERVELLLRHHSGRHLHHFKVRTISSVWPMSLSFRVKISALSFITSDTAALHKWQAVVKGTSRAFHKHSLIMC